MDEKALYERYIDVEIVISISDKAVASSLQTFPTLSNSARFQWRITKCIYHREIKVNAKSHHFILIDPLIHRRIDGVQGQINNIQGQINNVQGQINNVQNQMPAIQNQMTNMQGQFSSQFDAINEKIAELLVMVRSQPVTRRRRYTHIRTVSSAVKAM